ncbi:MAG: pirin family protein [Acidimicrobiia bacterium]|nr:pirin family protein [Acidimicrobiia bacterium]
MSGPVTPSDAPADDRGEPPHLPEVERLESRTVELGGVTVRRALPKRQRRTIGAWCFVDHLGPTEGASMQVGPHPHIGLHTVTWLLEGEALHLDSLGSERPLRPGQLNLMTAGNGVSHAEETPPSVRGRQHGAQLWVAQPETTRHDTPAFEHHSELPHVASGGLDATVLVGELLGHRSPARADTALLGAALSSRFTADTVLPLDPGFEHGIVVLSGAISVGADRIVPGELAYLGLGRDELALAVEPGTEALLLGGEPFEAPLMMWWNFVARHRDEVRTANADWDAGHERFGTVTSRLARIAAPTFV